MAQRQSGAWIGLAAILVAGAAAAEEPAGGESHVWRSAERNGAREYLFVHPVGTESYRVFSHVERPGELPEILWQRRFARAADAYGYALSQAAAAARDGFTEISPILTDPPEAVAGDVAWPTVTETRGPGIWKVTTAWTAEWEAKYATWFHDEFRDDFFQRYQISTDCADAAFAARWIFARINGLPAANRLPGSGLLMTQDSMRSAWASLPTATDWSQDRRFRAALDYLLDETYTHTLMVDTYPVAMSPEAIVPGTISLHFHDGNTGHTMQLWKVDLSGQNAPLTFVFSNVPKVVRVLEKSTSIGFVLPSEGKDALLHHRWPIAVAGGWKLAAPETLPY